MPPLLKISPQSMTSVHPLRCAKTTPTEVQQIFGSAGALSINTASPPNYFSVRRLTEGCPTHTNCYDNTVRPLFGRERKFTFKPKSVKYYELHPALLLQINDNNRRWKSNTPSTFRATRTAILAKGRTFNSY